MLRVAVLVAVAAMTGGCGSLLNAMIPANSRSNADAPEVVCVSFPDAPREVAPLAIAAVVAPIIAGIVVDQVAKGLEEEAKRYKASYSGRASSYLLKVTPASSGAAAKVELVQKRMRIDRYHGNVSKEHGCPRDLSDALRTTRATQIESERAMSFEAEMELGKNGEAIFITPTVFELKRTKSKVSAFRNKVDVNVQVTLTTFVKDDKATKQADIAQVDFPIGKIELADSAKPPAVRHLRSGWYFVPLSPGSVSGSMPQFIGPLNLTITVKEADDFGDVIGQGAKTVSENKAKIVEGLLKALGLQSSNKK